MQYIHTIKFVLLTAVAVLLVMLLSMINQVMAAQTQAIQLSSQFSSLAGPASVSFIVKALDSGAVMPYLINIQQAQAFNRLDLASKNYQIVGFKLQYRGGEYQDLCHFNSIITNKATLIQLSGPVGLADQVPSCHVQYVDVLPTSHLTNQAGVSSSTPIKVNTKTKISSKTSNGYQTIARYLSALKNHCQPGSYVANIQQKLVTYRIKGARQNHCAVDIAVAGGQPLHCLFNAADIQVLASTQQITALAQGKPSNNQQAAQIMAKHCQTGS